MGRPINTPPRSVVNMQPETIPTPVIASITSAISLKTSQLSSQRTLTSTAPIPNVGAISKSTADNNEENSKKRKPRSAAIERILAMSKKRKSEHNGIENM